MPGDWGPFEPGEGRLPPYLAGREPEQATLRAFVERLRNGRPAPSSVVLYGPRGNGKTALLGWVRQEVAGLNGERPGDESSVETLWFTPDELHSAADFAAAIAPSSWLDEADVTSVGLPGIVEISRKQSGKAPLRPLSQALAARVEERPLILLLDEAQNLDPEVGTALLNAAQKVGREAPLLLVLAGTPNLRARLRQMSATFWARSEQLPIGRLTAAGARDAVRIPLRRAGIGIADGALDAITARSRRYPFFVQLWGGAVWETANARSGAARAVGPADVEAAASVLARRTGLYYLDRYEELTDRGLLAPAWAVADAFGAGPPPRSTAPTLPEDRVEAALQHALGAKDIERVRETTEALFHLGYIWRSGSEPDWEPGIPSLMDYVWERVPEGRRPPTRRRT